MHLMPPFMACTAPFMLPNYAQTIPDILCFAAMKATKLMIIANHTMMEYKLTLIGLLHLCVGVIVLKGLP